MRVASIDAGPLRAWDGSFAGLGLVAAAAVETRRAAHVFFCYSVSRESFAKVANRLVARLHSLLNGEELVLIGHSLGEVLLRG